MPRIPFVEPEDASPEVRALYEGFAGPNLPVLNVMKLFGNHAGLLGVLTHTVGTLYHDPKLAPRYRELAYLRASQVNSCHY